MYVVPYLLGGFSAQRRKRDHHQPEFVMARRQEGNMNGERFCGNLSTTEIHDLDSETCHCKIDDIIAAGDDRAFTSLVDAQTVGYEVCAWCIGRKRR